MPADTIPLPPLAAPAPPVPSETWDTAELVRIVLEKLWLIALLAVTGFFVAYGYLAHLPPTYLATGSLIVQPPGAAPAARSLVDAEPNLGTVEQMNTLVQGLQRPAFLLEVANDPSLQGDASLFPPKAGGAAYTDQEKIRALVACLRITLQKGTLLINVAATHNQPATAQRICEAVLVNFVKDRMESKTGSEQETYRFLLGEAERLGHALADKERQIQKYDRLAHYDQEITAQRARLAALGQRYKDKYPAMIEERTLLQSLLDSFDAEMARIIRADEAEGGRPVVTMDAATGITDDLRARMISQYQVLRRDLETQRALFESLTAQKNQSDVMRGAQAETAVKIGDHPVLPEQPVSQDPARTLVVGTIIGALIGLGFAFLLSALDRSLQTVDQAEALLDLPVLSAVPEMTRRKKGRIADSAAPPPGLAQLPLLSDGQSTSAEAIRSLRAAMTLMGAEDDRRTVIFTSALPGEGKSFTAANYAVALAQQGLRTLLVDADLRRPTLHTVFGIEKRTAGIVDYLLTREPLDRFIAPSVVAGLDLMLCGTVAPNPAELLAGHGFIRLMREALQNYDRVVVDTAPINAVSDTLMLLGAIQSVCLVVRAASSPREAVRRTVRILAQAGRRPVGIVFNRVPRRAELSYHRAYYYHYGTADRYGEAYGSSPGTATTGAAAA